MPPKRQRSVRLSFGPSRKSLTNHLYHPYILVIFLIRYHVAGVAMLRRERHAANRRCAREAAARCGSEIRIINVFGFLGSTKDCSGETGSCDTHETSSTPAKLSMGVVIMAGKLIGERRFVPPTVFITFTQNDNSCPSARSRQPIDRGLQECDSLEPNLPYG